MFSSPPNLVQYIDKHISAICPFSIGKNDDQNHCAHFVSHVMEYDFQTTCRNYTLADRASVGSGANIRVNELFNRCVVTGEWDKKPESLQSCLVFVTIAGNMTQTASRFVMKDHHQKHVGIYMNGKVCNYSNSHRRVVSDDLLSFKRKFTSHYGKAGHAVHFYYGEFLK